MRVLLIVAALFACVLFTGCGAVGKLHSQFGVEGGKNFGEEAQQHTSTTPVVAELGYVPGGLNDDTRDWRFGGTAYTLIEDNLKPGIKAIARRQLAHNVSLDLSAGPMITYDSSSIFNGFTGGVAINLSFVTLRSEYVAWPFDAWDEYHYPAGHPEGIPEHHAAGHEQLWYTGASFNGTSSWWAFAVVVGLLIVAGTQGAFE